VAAGRARTRATGATFNGAATVLRVRFARRALRRLLPGHSYVVTLAGRASGAPEAAFRLGR